MDNRSIARRAVKRRRVNSNRSMPRKMGPIEPLSLRRLFHPTSFIKSVTLPILEINAANKKLIEAISNGEERYIRCHSFKWTQCEGISSTYLRIAKSLEWLEQNVRSDSISFLIWMIDKFHRSVAIREKLTNFIFDVSQKCKAQELVFAFLWTPDRLVNRELVDILIKDFFALPVVQGTIPTCVLNRYPGGEQYRSHLGENLIDQEVDSNGAVALYEIKSGDKRVRISFCHHDPSWNEYGKVCVKFYTV